MDAAELSAILKESDGEVALAWFTRYLARLYERVTHELTHVVREQPDSFTHAPKFYTDQMDMMLSVPMAAEQAEEWFNSLRTL